MYCICTVQWWTLLITVQITACNVKNFRNLPNLKSNCQKIIFLILFSRFRSSWRTKKAVVWNKICIQSGSIKNFATFWRHFRVYQLYPHFVVCHGDCKDACSYLTDIQFFKDVVIYNQKCIGDIVVCEFYRRFVYPWKFGIMVADTRDTSNKSCSCERDVADIKWDFENTWQPYREIFYENSEIFDFFYYFCCRYFLLYRDDENSVVSEGDAATLESQQKIDAGTTTTARNIMR